MEEQQAIVLLKQGDLSGLEALVVRYQVLAVHTAYLIVADRAQAEDIVQSAFLKAARRIDQYDTDRPFKPWFFKIVVNDSLKAARRGQRSLPLETLSQDVLDRLTSPNPGPEQVLETEELRRMVWDAMGQLSPEQRAVIILRHFLELDEAEMVLALKQPASTVKWRLHTARAFLKRLLQPRPDVPKAVGENHEEP